MQLDDDILDAVYERAVIGVADGEIRPNTDSSRSWTLWVGKVQ